MSPLGDKFLLCQIPMQTSPLRIFLALSRRENLPVQRMRILKLPHVHFDSPFKFCSSILKLWVFRWSGLGSCAQWSHVTWQRSLVGWNSSLSNGTFTSSSKHFVLSFVGFFSHHHRNGRRVWSHIWGFHYCVFVWNKSPIVKPKSVKKSNLSRQV